jgi:hypothetical protein
MVGAVKSWELRQVQHVVEMGIIGNRRRILLKKSIVEHPLQKLSNNLEKNIIKK